MFYKNVVRPILFAFDAEKIHDNLKKLMVIAGKSKLLRFAIKKTFRYEDKILNTVVDGNSFDNPIGLSAGFDKNGEMLNVVGEFGFGFEEVGSITGEHCAGNAKPRVHRAKTTGTGSINVFNGLNNYGAQVLAPKVKKELETSIAVGGISAAMINKPVTLEEGIRDYVKTVTQFAGIGQFLVVNISCPNVIGGEPFIDPRSLAKLLQELREVRRATNDTKPWYVKISPDLSQEEIESILDVTARYGVNGIVTTNLTKISNVEGSLSPKDFNQFWKDDILTRGGMSGELVRKKANVALRIVAQRIKDMKYDMITLGVGGITTADDAYFKIRNGASLLLLITSFVFEGPAVVGNINRGLAGLLRRDGFNSISEAVGVDLK